MSERSETHPLFMKLTEPEEIWRVCHEDPTNFNHSILGAYGLYPKDVDELQRRERERGEWDDFAWIYREAMRVEWLRNRSKHLFNFAMLAQWTGDHNIGRWCLAPAFGDPAKLRYTPTPEYGKADRQIVTSLGKFLTKHYPSLGAQAIREAQNRWLSNTKPVAFKFAETPDEVEHVYRNGPHSCMAAGGDDEPDEHPARIYGHCKHTRVAYVEDDAGRIVARCVVREDTDPKRYIRVYPNDQHRFAAALEAAGYVNNIEGLDGLLVPAIWSGDRLIMPYIDGVPYGALAPKGKVRLKTGCATRDDFSVQNTSGYAFPHGEEEDNSWACPSCDTEHPSDDESRYADHEGRTYCTACEDNYTDALNRHGDLITCHMDHCVQVEGLDENVIDSTQALLANGCHRVDDRWYHESMLIELHSGEWVLSDDAMENEDGKWVRREQNREELEAAGQERLRLQKAA